MGLESFLDNIFYDSLISLIKASFDIGYTVNIIGIENINNSSSGIIVANHSRPEKDKIYTHSFDHLLIGAYLEKGKKIHSAVRPKLYKNPLYKFLFKRLEQIPAHRKNIIEQSRKYLGREGEYILMFPEGEIESISHTGPKRIHSGLGELVYSSFNPNIFPVHISIKGKIDRLFPSFSYAEITFGKPFRYLDFIGAFPRMDNNKRVDFNQISVDIMNRVNSLDRSKHVSI